MFLPIVYRQALFAPGEALSAMGIENQQLPNSTLRNPTA
jgi:hypothetical protein